MSENPKFLQDKYSLHNAPEVESAAKRTEKRTGKQISQSPEVRIQNYLDRLEHLILDPDKKQRGKKLGNEPRPRALMLLREMMMNRYVRPHKEKKAEGAARVEERAARELGIDAHYGEGELAQRGEIAVTDLEKSLDSWILYLSDMNESYPAWFRYYVFRNILNLEDYDKDKGEFPERSKGTVRLFPDIDRGALAYVFDIIEAAKDQAVLQRLRKAQEAVETLVNELLTKEKATRFAKLSFAKQYAEGIRQGGEITPEMQAETRGRWIKYQRGTDPTALWASLQNKGTAWCTKGFATAETQLKGGDFYIYYTLDKQGKPTIPRIAIRMQENSIFEVRGVKDNHQNLEDNMIEIEEQKVNELPGAEKYRQATRDMKYLTEIDNKVKQGRELDKNDLIFLYEIEDSIQGFGYPNPDGSCSDPRIKELRNQRNKEEDMPIVFECEPNQIAHSFKEINQNTKAYVGQLGPGIFDLIQKYNIEHIYTSFPEEKFPSFEADLGGQSKQKLIKELTARESLEENDKDKIYIWAPVKDMLSNSDFFTLKNKERVKFIKLTVRDLGFPNGATIDQIFEKARELGLEPCPPETGPQIRLHYEEIFKREQPRGEYFWIAMKQIPGSDGLPDVFRVGRDDGGRSCLGGIWAGPSSRWGPDNRFVFRFRPPATPSRQADRRVGRDAA